MGLPGLLRDLDLQRKRGRNEDRDAGFIFYSGGVSKLS